MVAPSASPLTPAFAGKLLGGRHRAHGADAAGDTGQHHGAEQERAPADRRPSGVNSATGRTALATASAEQHAACGRSGRTAMPASGVTRITATAARVESPSAALSLSAPVETRKAGT